MLVCSAREQARGLSSPPTRGNRCGSRAAVFRGCLLHHRTCPGRLAIASDWPLAQRRQGRLDGLNLRLVFRQAVTLFLHHLGAGLAEKIGVGELAP